MNTPSREEFERLAEEQRQLKEEVRKLKEQQTEPIKIVVEPRKTEVEETLLQTLVTDMVHNILSKRSKRVTTSRIPNECRAFNANQETSKGHLYEKRDSFDGSTRHKLL